MLSPVFAAWWEDWLIVLCCDSGRTSAATSTRIVESQSSKCTSSITTLLQGSCKSILSTPLDSKSLICWFEISYKEDHLPKHMRLNFIQRLLRFLFLPICAMASVAILRHDPLYAQIADYCERRVECFAACVNSNFPYLNCEARELEIEYNGNMYTEFFFYPKPTQEKSEAELAHYAKCKDYINDVSRQLPLATTILFVCSRMKECHSLKRARVASWRSIRASPSARQLLTAISVSIWTREASARSAKRSCQEAPRVSSVCQRTLNARHWWLRLRLVLMMIILCVSVGLTSG